MHWENLESGGIIESKSSGAKDYIRIHNKKFNKVPLRKKRNVY